MQFCAASVQLAPFKGRIEENLNRIAEAVLRCSEEGAELIVFPETITTGYFLEGGVAELAMTSQELVARLHCALKACSGNKTFEKDIDVILGFYEQEDGILYNSAAHINFQKGNPHLLHVHKKFFLPTYGVFDEERFVARGKKINTYSTRFGEFAILICEDVWHSISATIAALKGAEVIAVLAASPVRGVSSAKYDNLERYERMLRAIGEEHGVWVINSMLVGFEGGKGFCGGSIIVDPFGKIRAQGPLAEEFILIADIDLDEIPVARQQFPALADLRSVLDNIIEQFQECETQC